MSTDLDRIYLRLHYKLFKAKKQINIPVRVRKQQFSLLLYPYGGNYPSIGFQSEPNTLRILF